MNNFHKLKENFQKFLNEGFVPKETDTIPGYINAEYDEIDKVHKELKEALLDVARASLASAAYNYGPDLDADRTKRSDPSALSNRNVKKWDPNWKKYLNADFSTLGPRSLVYTGIRQTYRDKPYWEGRSAELGMEYGNNLLYYLHHNADALIKALGRKQDDLAERDLRGKDWSDEKVKEKYKAAILQFEAYEKAIKTYKNYKKVLDTKGRPYSKYGKYNSPPFD